MKRFKYGLSGLLMALGLTAALPTVADEVVAYAAGGWFAVDSRAVKDTTLSGGPIVGGASNLLLQSSPDAWGEAGGGVSATIVWQDVMGGSGTVAEATTAREVAWTPTVRTNVKTLTYTSGSVRKTARFLTAEQVGDDAWARIMDGVCTISGTGNTWDFTGRENPLSASGDAFANVVVAEGVTGLGPRALYDFDNVKNVTIAASVTSVGSGALVCPSLENLIFLGALPTMAADALSLRAMIRMDGEPPVVYAKPCVKVNGKDPTVKGKNGLLDPDPWEIVEPGQEKNYHFFKIVL